MRRESSWRTGCSPKKRRLLPILQELEYQEVSQLISDTIENLPERTREIFRLNRQEGLKYREIAERLSISEKTVEANMGKALKALRNSMEKYEQRIDEKK